MKLISRKLRSKTGASMLIAILFMMFCLFVGGSVLAAATANGYRVAHMADQQDFLSQRSAATLIADEIDGGRQVSSLTMMVGDLHIHYQPMKHLDGGGWEEDTTRDPSEERVITFEAPFTSEKQMTVMQRLIYETAVCRYLKEHSIDTSKTTITLENFWYDGAEITALTWYPYNANEAQIQGTIDIKGQVTGETGNFADYKAYFTSGDKENLYDFMVTFDNSQMTVGADAYMSVTQIYRPVERVDHATKGFVEITYDNNRTDITWEWAYIQKGGKG